MTIGHLDLRPPASPLPGGSEGDGSGLPISSPLPSPPLSEARLELLADIRDGDWDDEVD